MKNCCFTGHRRLKVTNALKIKLTAVLQSLIIQGITDFYAGGALGWDMLCEEIVLELRIKYPQIRLHLVLPCFPEEQTAEWNKEQKAAYYRILTSADSVEYTSVQYTPKCMKRRNVHLVELVDCCVCYYHAIISDSGTRQTVRMAREKGIRIINFYK